MKHLISPLFALVLLLAPAAEAEAQSTIGYTTGAMGKSTIGRFGSSEKQGLAIKLSHDKIQALAGQTISSVKLAFGSRNTADKCVSLFLTTDLDGEPLLTQEIAIDKANKWQTNTLDSPYTITGQEEALFLGFTASIPTTYNLLQTDHANNLRDCSFAWNNDHWTDLYGTGFGSANIYLGFDNTVEFTDVLLASLDLESNYYVAGQPYSHATHIFNFGTRPITSVDVTMQCGEEQNTLTINDLNIPQYGTHEVALPQLSALESGHVGMQVSIHVNDATELDLTDNSFESSAFFYPQGMERNLLVEEFTGQNCSNCPAGKRTLEMAIEQSGLPCVSLMHHSGYMPDIFTTDADSEYTWFYGTSSTYAPAAMFNRLTNPLVGAVPVINVGMSDCLSSLEYASRQQPYVSMALSSEFDPDTHLSNISLRLYAHNDLPDYPVFNIYLVQDSVIASQSGAGADYRHDGLVRKVLTDDIWGLDLPQSFVSGQVFEYTVSYELPEYITSDYFIEHDPRCDIYTDPEHTRIVAYVANCDLNDYNNNRIYNCIEVPLIEGAYTQQGMSQIDGIETITAEAPATSGMITDLSGRQHKASAGFRAGLYIIDGRKVWIR